MVGGLPHDVVVDVQGALFGNISLSGEIVKDLVKLISDWFRSRPGRNCPSLVNDGQMEQVIKNRCLNGSVHVYVESLKWNIISDKYLQ